MVGFSLNRLARELKSVVVGASDSSRSKAVRQRNKAEAPSMDSAVSPKITNLKATDARPSSSNRSASNLAVVKIASAQKFRRRSPKLFDSQLDQDAQLRLF